MKSTLEFAGGRSALLDETALAKLLNIKLSTLRSWRVKGNCGPPFVRIGRCVRYDPKDVAAFINQQKFNHTTEAANAQ